MHSHEEASRHVAGSSIVDIANQIFIAKRAIYGTRMETTNLTILMFSAIFFVDNTHPFASVQANVDRSFKLHVSGFGKFESSKFCHQVVAIDRVEILEQIRISRTPAIKSVFVVFGIYRIISALLAISPTNRDLFRLS